MEESLRDEQYFDPDVFIFNGVSPTVEAFFPPVKLFHRLPGSLSAVNNLLFKKIIQSLLASVVFTTFTMYQNISICLRDRLNVLRVCHYSIAY